MQANAAVNAGGKVNPVPVCSFGIFAGTGVDAGNRTGIHTIGNAFAGISNNRMGHRLSRKYYDSFLA